MTSVTRLMAVGMPGPQADLIGCDNAAGLVGTGGTKAAAVQLLGDYNQIATCASAGVAAFQLPPAEFSPILVILNNGASPALVFGAGTTETINALTANASFSATNGKVTVFYPSKITTTSPPTARWIAFVGT